MKKKILLAMSFLMLAGAASARPWYPPTDGLEFEVACVKLVGGELVDVPCY